MLDWIKNNFEIVENGWINENGDKEDALTFMNNGKQITAPVLWFCSTFIVETPPTLESLKSCDAENKLGWHMHFEAWKEQGLLN